ncbi:GTPase-activating protein GYP5 [Pseudocercospora fuligena]|uniref:GTPase-activating protein GYP5 n=1 Tax=Pseudocercospora fuligena TaxID=685502 RepID=A0A8H6VDV6_9PEZI|nr:GTPase-activating protein GYP5 [Pseudocercospora fuligena]
MSATIEAIAIATASPDESLSSNASPTLAAADVHVTEPDTSDLPTTPTSPATIRNQAPGIPDRRKSLRPSPSGRASRGGRKSSGISIKVTMADMASEMRLKESEEDADTFEDAAETTTPRPASTNEPDADAGATKETATATQNGVPNTSGANDAGTASVETSDPQKQTSTDQQAQSQADTHSRTSTLDSKPSLPPSRDRSVSPGKVSSRQGSPVRTMNGLSGDVTAPAMPPPSSTERRHNLEQRDSARSPPPQPGNFARKASSGFGALLGRMGSIRKPARSPPAPRSDRLGLDRRNTAASTTSVESNGLSTIHDAGKPSLQDQFSNLRRQEEFSTGEANGHVINEDDEKTPVQASPCDVASPPGSPPPNALKSPTLNPSLPPGTASGMSVGPSEEPREVNWDLWQQLVYDGPKAVSRTGEGGLNEAVQAGIPPAIRVVVWQVLAESKNEDLENIYRTLKARGTEAEIKPANSRSGSTVGMNGSVTDKDDVKSDASSDRSVHSTSANSGIASPPTSVESAPEAKSNLLAEKQKREAAALQKLEKAIKRDMGTRTSYSKYTQSAGLQDGLFGVCKAYALFDEGVGYAQGINFIAMPLLFNMSEEEAFTLLYRLMSKYDLRSMFTPDMVGLHLRLYQFERLLEELEPAIYCHLRRRHVGPDLYATQWFLTLFAYRFPLQLVLRIYDLIFSEGLTAILKFGIVLMQRNRDALLGMKDMGQLTNFLKEKLFDVYIDKSPSASSLLDSGFFGSVTGGADKELYRADEMVRDACSVQISEEKLKAYTVEWEESQKEQREREAELENLRVTNMSLTNRVKLLEDRVQQHDTEHVTIAQDLVRIKVENDSLQDTNEALKLQVVELQKMVDAQPAEVEAKLKEEMERIMQRNIEVQNENRALKEELDEMEHEVVNAKMAHAQTQTEYDTMKQKWMNVQALLNDKQ